MEVNKIIFYSHKNNMILSYTIRKYPVDVLFDNDEGEKQSF